MRLRSHKGMEHFYFKKKGKKKKKGYVMQRHRLEAGVRAAVRMVLAENVRSRGVFGE